MNEILKFPSHLDPFGQESYLYKLSSGCPNYTTQKWCVWAAFQSSRKRFRKFCIWTIQFVIFNPWKGPWNWIAFYQNSFVISLELLYHLNRRDHGRLSNEAFMWNPIVSSKQWFNGLKITNCISGTLFSNEIFVWTFLRNN